MLHGSQIWRRIFVLAAVFLGCTLASSGHSRLRPASAGRLADPRVAESRAAMGGEQTLLSVPAGGAPGLFVAGDTVFYGGTVWNPDSSRYEAIRGGTWTFDSGVGSSFVTTPGTCKPVGYHRTMEGWSEVDVTTARETSTWRRRTECAVQGTHSMHLGWSQVEADSLCYVTGAGYGSNWDETLAKTFVYPGTGNVTLSFDYRVDSEPSYDYLYVYVDTTGTLVPDWQTTPLVVYTGLVAGHATFVLHPHVELRSTPGPVRLLFRGTSDGAYDDEDGFFPSTCGLATLDNITLSGALVDAADFESSPNGWVSLPHPCGSGGLWADLRDSATLAEQPPPCTGPCALSDSVLVFMDLAGHHPGLTENFAASPWIDLKAGGDTGRTGRFIQFDGYFDMPLRNFVWIELLVEWYPSPCPVTGRLMRSGWVQYGFLLRPGNEFPYCTSPGSPYRVDISSLIPADAEQVRIGVGVINQCDYFSNCSGISNSTPWIDNVRFGVYVGEAKISTQASDVLTDEFASDGTLNPASPARVDVNAFAPGDTLVCRGDGGNQEVRVNLRVRPGPFTDTAALAAWAAAKWTPNPAAGPEWWSARMDTAESFNSLQSGVWMGTLHESDPKFGGGTDRDRGGDGDAHQLSHDIFPDHLLTPGARIDYFFSTRFLPPDPRNPSGAAWSVLPDTTGGHYLEMEVLPSSMTSDTTWNCILSVNAHALDGAPAKRAAEESALNVRLGGGGTNAEGTRFDRFDMNSRHFARSSIGTSGPTALQLGAYGAVAWQSAHYHFVPNDSDVAVLTGWLNSSTPALPRRLWLSGRSMGSGLRFGTSAQQAFLSTVFGLFTPQTVTAPTTCSALTTPIGAPFPNSAALDLRLICQYRDIFSLVLTPDVQAQLGGPSGVTLGFSRDFPSTAARAQLDVFAPSDLRLAGTGCPLLPDAAIAARTGDVLDWFGWPNGGFCTPGGVSGVPPGNAAGTPRGLPSLALTAATPQAGGGTWRIGFSLRMRGGATLRLFDVTGRAVRTLLDADALEAGPQEATWDGRGDRGERLAAGLYFLRLSAGGEARTLKLIVRE